MQEERGEGVANLTPCQIFKNRHVMYFFFMFYGLESYYSL